MLFMVFAAANIGGPFFFKAEDAPRYVLAITVILVCFCAAFFCAIALRVYMILQNRTRDRRYGKLETAEDKLEGMRLGMHDKTELENVDFRYVL
tara:strand:+ start:3126 stop:3407 length:282 start_codon:yes stop_codon:yes gene_type:complete